RDQVSAGSGSKWHRAAVHTRSPTAEANSPLDPQSVIPSPLAFPTIALPISMALKSRAFLSLNERVAFLRLLLRWQASIWKLLLWDLFVFLVAYIGISLLYRRVLLYHEGLRAGFEGFVHYSKKISSIVPISFLLGFFVSTILQRWWIFVHKLPLMSGPAFVTHAFVGSEEQMLERTGFRIRRALIRYMNLSWILLMIGLSWEIKNRFKPRINYPAFVMPYFQTAPRAGRSVCLPKISETEPAMLVGGRLGRGQRNSSIFGSILRREVSPSRGSAIISAAGSGSFRESEAAGPSVEKQMPLPMRSRKLPRVGVTRCMELINGDPVVRRHFGQLITQEEIDVFVRREEMQEWTVG
ncbi:unnamed protein product, partial [Protopolystoma xenopodis]